MQNILMKFDPATGEERPYPSHAAQWRNWHGVAAWLFDPWTGKRRNAYDVGSDVHGLLIVPAGTLGGDTGCGASKQNKHEAMVCAQRSPTPVGVMEDIPICECGAFWDQHHDECPVRREVESLRAAITRLREYARHDPSCKSWGRIPCVCDCGYDKLTEESK